MLDFNHGATLPQDDPRAAPIIDRINDLIDVGMIAAKKQEKQRDYLGASMLGHECKRHIQYEFTRTPKDPDTDFTGKQLRIFDAGHQFEALSVKWFRQAGFTLLTEKPNGQQFGFSVAKGRISGHIDGVLVDGPSWMKYPALWEHKALNEKNWQDVSKKGLSVSKPIYAAQVALYQGYMPDLAQNPALFTALNKNTEELYHELVPFDTALAQSTSDKAVDILRSTDAGILMPRMAANSTHFGCKFCPYFKRCWQQ
jgi:hypothetical protein